MAASEGSVFGGRRLVGRVSGRVWNAVGRALFGPGSRERGGQGTAAASADATTAPQPTASQPAAPLSAAWAAVAGQAQPTAWTHKLAAAQPRKPASRAHSASTVGVCIALPNSCDTVPDDVFAQGVATTALSDALTHDRTASISDLMAELLRLRAEAKTVPQRPPAQVAPSARTAAFEFEEDQQADEEEAEEAEQERQEREVAKEQVRQETAAREERERAQKEADAEAELSAILAARPAAGSAAHKHKDASAQVEEVAEGVLESAGLDSRPARLTLGFAASLLLVPLCSCVWRWSGHALEEEMEEEHKARRSTSRTKYTRAAMEEEGMD